MTYTETKIIRPSDIYEYRPNIPEGLKVVAFRPTQPGETFVAKCGIIVWHAGTYSDNPPRLILQSIPPVENWWE